MARSVAEKIGRKLLCYYIDVAGMTLPASNAWRSSRVTSPCTRSIGITQGRVVNVGGRRRARGDSRETKGHRQAGEDG